TNSYHPTEALVLGNPRRHYRATIGTLRNLISVEKRNIVYYPSGAGNLQVQRLDTDTRETETVNILPFLPRCLVAKNGWICAGGETGEFTAMDMNENRFAPDITTDDAALEQALDSNPDASQLLELSGDLASSLRVRQSIRTLAHARKNLVGKSKQFGKERVNCITLWFPPTMMKPFEGAYDEPVAVLANNDKSVAIVSLKTQELLIEIEYPDCVNRAACSPDGRLLIAISDDPYLYVYEQACINEHQKDSIKDDRSDNRGSFAACFSSSGRYLAVGTQYGAISVFDTTTITNPEVISLVTTFSSSRPSNTLGAVRAMEFAPGPVDLLAWTEDRGRVGVADLRDGCISRQILHLDKEDDYDHISLSDRGSIDPRLLDSRRTTRSPPTDMDVMSVARHLANPTNADADALERINQPLSPEETRVLEALQEHSRRRDQRAATRASTAAQRIASLSNLPRPSTTTSSSSEVARTERSAIVSSAVNDVLSSIRDIRDQRDRIRENIERQERLRNYARGPNARRPSGAPPGAPPADDPPSARRALASRLMGDLPPSTSAWSDLEALWNLSFDTAPHAALFDSATATDADLRRRDRAAFLIREWETNPARRMGLGLRNSIADPFDTAGLAWSEDGRKLFIGAEKGIYEFHVNMLNRKFVPT
ncbi:WD40-repeat-containing domain protein, partial [Coniochaeta sp. 2T2.1]